jgi:UDP-glucose 4-epimerase
MAVLVTGGAGYIGSHMVWQLLDAGEAVVVIDRLSMAQSASAAPEARYYCGDIGDISLLRKIASENDIDSIMHFAGSIVVPESVADPLAYYENNTVKSHGLIAFAVETGIPHFVFSSTAAVYGSAGGVAPVAEDACLAPASPYGRSKLMTEIMLRDAATATGLIYTALRYFNVSGADAKLRAGQSSNTTTHLIKIASQVIVGDRDHIEIFGTDYDTPDGTCIRDYIHVSDLVDAHLKALYRMRNGGGSLTANCGYGRGFSVLEVLNEMKILSGCDFKVHYGPRRAGDPVSIVSDPTLAKKELGWTPTHDSLQDIISSTIAWEKHLKQTNCD